jgi:hypothetical protein
VLSGPVSQHRGRVAVLPLGGDMDNAAMPLETYVALADGGVLPPDDDWYGGADGALDGYSGAEADIADASLLARRSPQPGSSKLGDSSRPGSPWIRPAATAERVFPVRDERQRVGDAARWRQCREFAIEQGREVAAREIGLPGPSAKGDADDGSGPGPCGVVAPRQLRLLAGDPDTAGATATVHAHTERLMGRRIFNVESRGLAALVEAAADWDLLGTCGI